jgi:hypothetical protein
VPHDFHYPGDVVMARLLRELECPRGIDECRALLRGAVAAQRAPLPSVLVRELFSGREPRFRNLAHADEFVSSLFGLVGRLDRRFCAQAWLDDLRPAGVGSLEDRAGLRYGETRAFLRGLDLGATDPAALDDDGRAALGVLADASAQLGAIAGLCAAYAPTDADLSRGAGLGLEALEQMVEEATCRLERSLRATRAADGSRSRDAGVGPSDLCACGSGKPHRRCCGAMS